MKKVIKFAIIILMVTGNVNAQKYITKNGKISFFSDGQAEKIEAFNNQVNTAIDITSGDIVFKVLMKSFEFEKALMQEHFNENYVESAKFPNATFKGKITNLSEINFTKNGKYEAIVEGDLTIHGVTKKVKHTGIIEVKDGKILINAKFPVTLKDYDIKIPNTVLKNIAEIVDITVAVSLEKIK
jgi:polyisoprenoid-binding protein YceI